MHKRYEIHDKSSRGLYNKHKTIFDELMSHAERVLKYDRPVKIYLLGDEDNADKTLGKTGFYNPDDDSVSIFATNRHIKDILRSLAHELVHHKQNCEGGFDRPMQTKLGYAQDDEDLRDKEEEAYKLGNLLVFRDFEDNYKRENPTMQEQRFKTLNKKITDMLLSEIITERESRFRNLQAKAREAAAKEKEEEWTAGEAAAATATGTTLLQTPFTAWMWNRAKKSGGVEKLAKELQKRGVPNRLVKEFSDELVKAGAEGAEEAVKPGRLKRLVSKSGDILKSLLKKGGKPAEWAATGLKKWAGNLAAQQRYFGVGSKYVLDKTSGKLIQKMTSDQIAKAAEKKGAAAFEKALARSIKGRTKTALQQKVGTAAEKGKKALADQLVKQSKNVKRAQGILDKAASKSANAAKKLDAMKAANKAKPFTHGTNEIKKAEDALKAAKELEKKATKSFKGVSKRAIARAEKEAIKQIEKEVLEKGLDSAAKEAIEKAARESAKETAERVAVKTTAELTKAGGRLATGGAQQAAKRAAAKSAVSAGAQLAGKAGAGAALGAAFSVLSAAEVGYYIGKGINAWLLSQSETEEQKDRIKDGQRNVDNAEAELDVYFGFYGKLCIKRVKCLGPGKAGGYNYETASSEESWASSFFGLDYGGRNKTGLGFGKYIQVEGYNSKDILVIVGLMDAIIRDDIKNKKIVLEGDKYKVESNARVEKYIEPFVSLLKTHPQAFGRVKSSEEGLRAISSILTVLGLQPMKRDGEEITSETAQIEKAVDAVYKALKGTGTDERTVWYWLSNYDKETGKPVGLFGADTDKKMPKFVNAVEKRFNKKYPNFDEGGLRGALDDDMDGDDLKLALKFFNPVDGTVDQKLAAVAAAAAGGKAAQAAKVGKCDVPPVLPGCRGKMPAYIYKILYIGVPGFKEKISEEDLAKDTYDEKLQQLIADFQKQAGIPVKPEIMPSSKDQTNAALTKVVNDANRGKADRVLEEASLKQKRLEGLNKKLMRGF